VRKRRVCGSVWQSSETRAEFLKSERYCHELRSIPTKCRMNAKLLNCSKGDLGNELRVQVL